MEWYWFAILLLIIGAMLLIKSDRRLKDKYKNVIETRTKEMNDLIKKEFDVKERDYLLVETPTKSENVEYNLTVNAKKYHVSFAYDKEKNMFLEKCVLLERGD